MNRVKVIKRGDIKELTSTRKHTESDLRRQANEIRRRASDTVTDWISEWREQKEKAATEAVRKFLRPTPFKPA